jgi:hypothetical protein
MALANAVFQASTSLMALVGEGLGLRTVNAPFAQLFGTSIDELRGKTLGDLAETAAALDQLQQLLTTGDVEGSPVRLDLVLRDSKRRLRMQARVLPSHDAPNKRVLLLSGAGDGKTGE